jgi:hypothetical protein
MERHKSGIVHYHVAAAVNDDVWTCAAGHGFIDYEACADGDGRTANRHLKAIWRYFGNPDRPAKAHAHGFGINGWLPIRSTEEAIGRYVGKYVAKHIGQRQERDKGARLVRYSQGAATWSTRFSLEGFADPEHPGRSVLLASTWLWRRKFERLATALGCSPGDYGVTGSERGKFLPFAKWFGDGWAYWLGPIIESIKLPVYRTGLHAAYDYPERFPLECTQADLASMSDVRMDDGRDARTSLTAAVAAALNLKDRGRHREPRKFPSSASDGQTAPIVAPSPLGTLPSEARPQSGGFRSWIEQTCKED